MSDEPMNLESLEGIKRFAALESTEPQDFKTLTLTRQSLGSSEVETTEWVSREDFDRLQARAVKLEYLFKATERLALVDGGWEAVKIGTYYRLEAEINRLKAEIERLRKAGDWMCGLLQFDFVTKEWNAAKEKKSTE